MKLKLWRSLLLSIFFTSAIATRAKSQITSDGTTNTTVNSTDSTIIIEQGDRAQDNFYSFKQFDLANGNEAFFDNQSDVVNISSRVTGGDISNIEGLIKAVEQNLCQLGQGSEFVVTGKGGIAPSPIQARDRDVGGVDLVKPVFSEAGGAGEAGEAEGAREIIEAQGWIVNDRGMVELVASKTDIYGNYSEPQVECHQPGIN